MALLIAAFFAIFRYDDAFHVAAISAALMPRGAPDMPLMLP